MSMNGFGFSNILIPHSVHKGNILLPSPRQVPPFLQLIVRSCRQGRLYVFCCPKHGSQAAFGRFAGHEDSAAFLWVIRRFRTLGIATEAVGPADLPQTCCRGPPDCCPHGDWLPPPAACCPRHAPASLMLPLAVGRTNIKPMQIPPHC